MYVRRYSQPSNGFDMKAFCRAANVNFDEDFMVLDIEAVKVPAPANWPCKTRFKPVMVGVGVWRRDVFDISIGASDNERELIEWTDDVLGLAKCVMFHASRDFDRVVLEGRWVQYRRSHSSVPGPWPHLEVLGTDEDVCWVNLSKILKDYPQQVDRSTDSIFGSSHRVLDMWPLS